LEKSQKHAVRLEAFQLKYQLIHVTFLKKELIFKVIQSNKKSQINVRICLKTLYDVEDKNRDTQEHKLS